MNQSISHVHDSAGLSVHFPEQKQYQKQKFYREDVSALPQAISDDGTITVAVMNYYNKARTNGICVFALNCRGSVTTWVHECDKIFAFDITGDTTGYKFRITAIGKIHDHRRMGMWSFSPIGHLVASGLLPVRHRGHTGINVAGNQFILRTNEGQTATLHAFTLTDTGLLETNQLKRLSRYHIPNEYWKKQGPGHVTSDGVTYVDADVITTTHDSKLLEGLR